MRKRSACWRSLSQRGLTIHSSYMKSLSAFAHISRTLSGHSPGAQTESDVDVYCRSTRLHACAHGACMQPCTVIISMNAACSMHKETHMELIHVHTHQVRPSHRHARLPPVPCRAGACAGLHGAARRGDTGLRVSHSRRPARERCDGHINSNRPAAARCWKTAIEQ